MFIIAKHHNSEFSNINWSLFIWIRFYIRSSHYWRKHGNNWELYFSLMYFNCKTSQFRVRPHQLGIMRLNCVLNWRQSLLAKRGNNWELCISIMLFTRMHLFLWWNITNSIINCFFGVAVTSVMTLEAYQWNIWQF